MKAALLAAAFLAAVTAAQAGDLPGGSVHRASPLRSLVTSAPILEGTERIDAARAISFAVAALEAHGVSGISVCEVHAIEAPLTGYLFDALGVLEEDGHVFTTFRVGIRDGREQTNGMFAAGEEFVFMARGVDPDGTVRWLPAPGPDAAPGEGWDESLLDFEFLLYRDEFESLAVRYQAE